MAVLGPQGWVPLTADSGHFPRVAAADSDHFLRVAATSNTPAIAAPRVIATVQLNRWSAHH